MGHYWGITGVIIKRGTNLTAAALTVAFTFLCPDSKGADNASQSPDGAGNESSIKIFKYRDRTGAISFSDKAPVDRRYQVIHYRTSCYACNPFSTVDWHSTPLQLYAYRDQINLAARQFGVDPALIRAVIHAESAFKASAKSKKGALGLMQLMPETAKDMGVADALSPDQNIQGGVRYLAWLLNKTQGNTTLATAAYNAGPGAVERHKGIPPYEETQTYVKRVKILHDRYRIALAGT
ncbi:MAG: lytic transglycosylase domain-containing protein [Pseudomonadota bacterium]